jgi:hypothetical protein
MRVALLLFIGGLLAPNTNTGVRGTLAGLVAVMTGVLIFRRD